MKELIKRSVVDSGSLVAIECMTMELFEDESSSQLVTSDKISDWVAATSTSGCPWRSALGQRRWPSLSHYRVMRWKLQYY